MEGFANVGVDPIPHDIFQEMMDTPSTLNDVFFDRRGREQRQYSRQSRTYPRGHSGMMLPPATQHGGMPQGGFNLQDTTLTRQSSGFDMAPQGRATFVSAPDGVSYDSPGQSSYGNGGHSAATSGSFTPGPDTSQNFTGSEMQTGSDFDGLPGSDTTFY